MKKKLLFLLIIVALVGFSARYQDPVEEYEMLIDDPVEFATEASINVPPKEPSKTYSTNKTTIVIDVDNEDEGDYQEWRTRKEIERQDSKRRWN